MAAVEAEYDSFADEYVKWKDECICNPVERYTVHNIMLKPLANDYGQLIGKRVLDLACGHGYLTRQMKELKCDYILGVDISSALIKIARDIEKKNPQGIEYLVADAKDLPTFEQPFDLITAFFLLHFAQTRDELVDMVRVIYTRLGENKHFIGLIANPFPGKDMFNKRKYSITRVPKAELRDGPIPDGTEFVVTFYNADDKPWFNFSNYHYSPETYEQVFKDVGFKSFQWIPYQCDPAEYNAEFYENLLKNSPTIGIVATK